MCCSYALLTLTGQAWEGRGHGHGGVRTRAATGAAALHEVRNPVYLSPTYTCATCVRNILHVPSPQRLAGDAGSQPAGGNDDPLKGA